MDFTYKLNLLDDLEASDLLSTMALKITHEFNNYLATLISQKFIYTTYPHS